MSRAKQLAELLNSNGHDQWAALDQLGLTEDDVMSRATPSSTASAGRGERTARSDPMIEAIDGWKNMAPAYRAGVEAANGACPIEVGIMGYLADNECKHGWLGHEAKGQACGCWMPDTTRRPKTTATPTEVPDLMATLKPAKPKRKREPKPVPVLRSVVLDLEREIERLRAAKARLEEIEKAA
jgi:hypothetical protein